MQICSAKVKFSKLVVKFPQYFRRRFSCGHYCLEEEKRVKDAVAFRKVTLNADSAGLFCTDENVIRKHELGDVLKADWRLVELEIVSGGYPFQKHGLRKRSHYRAGHLSPANKMQQDEWHDVVHRHGSAQFVNRSDAISIAVGS